jgi:hypothetical protein
MLNADELAGLIEQPCTTQGRRPGEQAHKLLPIFPPQNNGIPEVLTTWRLPAPDTTAPRAFCCMAPGACWARRFLHQGASRHPYRPADVARRSTQSTAQAEEPYIQQGSSEEAPVVPSRHCRHYLEVCSHKQLHEERGSGHRTRASRPGNGTNICLRLACASDCRATRPVPPLDFQGPPLFLYGTYLKERCDRSGNEGASLAPSPRYRLAPPKFCRGTHRRGG